MTKPNEMPWYKVHECSSEHADGTLDFQASEGHSEEEITGFYSPISCCCKKPEHKMRTVIKNGRFIPEEQALALFEAANIIVKYQHQILNEGTDDFMRAIALLKKGIGE